MADTGDRLPVPAPGSGGLYSSATDLGRLVSFLLDQTGTVNGFHSMLALAPEKGTGVAVLTNTGGLDGRGAAPPLGVDRLRTLVGLPLDPLRTDLPPRPEVWSALCGWYAPRPGPVTNLFTGALMGAGAEVSVVDRTLVLRFLTPVPALGRGLPLHLDDSQDPYVFRIDLSAAGMGTLPVVFDRGRPASPRLFVDLIELERRPDARNPRRLATGMVAAEVGAVAVQALRDAWALRNTVGRR